jgi:hypothetical protein
VFLKASLSNTDYYHNKFVAREPNVSHKLGTGFHVGILLFILPSDFPGSNGLQQLSP